MDKLELFLCIFTGYLTGEAIIRLILRLAGGESPTDQGFDNSPASRAKKIAENEKQIALLESMLGLKSNQGPKNKLNQE